MKHKALLPLLAGVILAGCAESAPITAPEAPQLNLTNQAPVAVMNNYSRKPIYSSGATVFRFYFHANDSYDPDGYITSYYWYPQYHCRIDSGTDSTFYIDVPANDTCGLSLTVTDNNGATGYTVQYYSW
jgi:hypothetical protein